MKLKGLTGGQNVQAKKSPGDLCQGGARFEALGQIVSRSALVASIVRCNFVAAKTPRMSCSPLDGDADCHLSVSAR